MNRPYRNEKAKMSTTIFSIIIVTALIVGLLVGIVKLIKEPKGAGFASMTAFHDMQAKDKQAGIESVIEHQAEKKMSEQKSGQDKK